MTRKVFPLLNVTFQHYNIFKRLFSAGWTAKRAQQYMSGQGMGYRWTTILAVKRDVTGLLKHENMFAGWSKGQKIHKGFFEEISFEAPFKYRINYYVDCTDAITGQVTTRSWTSLFDDFIDPYQITGEILARLNVERYPEFSEFSNIHVRNVQHQAGMSY